MLPPRSLLFVPGHQEKMLAKAATLAADAVVFDLEDSVPLTAKDAARTSVSTTLHNWPIDAPLPFVRVQPPSVGAYEDDLAVVNTHPTAGVVIPKVNSPFELDRLLDKLIGARDVVINIETPRSVLNAIEFADHPQVTAVFLGGEDLTHAIGANRTAGGNELDWARHQVLYAARAAGILAFDTICPEFRDLPVLEAEAAQAAAMGFDGKFAIHPAQIPGIHAAFTPSAGELERARRIVDAFAAALQRGDAAVEVDGQMVDPPVAARAQAVLNRGQRN